jgi:hypothetical protein
MLAPPLASAPNATTVASRGATGGCRAGRDGFGGVGTERVGLETGGSSNITSASATASARLEQPGPTSSIDRVPWRAPRAEMTAR